MLILPECRTLQLTTDVVLLIGGAIPGNPNCSPMFVLARPLRQNLLLVSPTTQYMAFLQYIVEAHTIPQAPGMDNQSAIRIAKKCTKHINPIYHRWGWRNVFTPYSRCGCACRYHDESITLRAG